MSHERASVSPRRPRYAQLFLGLSFTPAALRPPWTTRPPSLSLPPFWADGWTTSSLVRLLCIHPFLCPSILAETLGDFSSVAFSCCVMRSQPRARFTRLSLPPSVYFSWFLLLASCLLAPCACQPTPLLTWSDPI